MSKHTPGPWAVQPGARDDRVWSNEGFIADVWSPSGDVASNSHLIAAAPEMLAALREVEEFLDDQAEAEYFTDRASPVPNQAMRLLVEVREAIAKAEGAK